MTVRRAVCLVVVVVVVCVCMFVCVGGGGRGGACSDTLYNSFTVAQNHNIA